MAAAREKAALAERERAAEMHALHREYLPELEPFFRELYALGMVSGWRAIQNVTIKEDR